jgi:hypothetical protein
MDSTPLAVGDTHRMATHKVFAGLARRGKTSRGWYYGFTLPLLVNDEGALLAGRVTPGNGDDRRPVERLATGLGGPLCGDRGSLSQAVHDALLSQGLARLTTIRRNMQPRLMRLWDKLLLRKRALMETLNAQWKNIRHIAPTRHRSVTGCMVHLVAGLVAYRHRPTKPSLGLRSDLLGPMLVM